MIQIPGARGVDISGLVRLRKHLAGASPWVGAIGLVVFLPTSALPLQDEALIVVDGVLAFAIYLLMLKGWLSAFTPLVIALVTLTTVLTGRFVFASWPIDTGDERGVVSLAVAAVAVSLYALYIALGPTFREARRSPYLDLVFATRRTLGADYAGAVLQRIRDAAIGLLIIGTSQGLAWELSRLRDLGQLHQLILLFPPADDVVTRWLTLLARDRATGFPILPDAVRPQQTLALIYADDLTPIIIEGARDEWSYETAVRIGGMLAITTGAEPAVGRA
jgi:hypothetical protein